MTDENRVRLIEILDKFSTDDHGWGGTHDGIPQESIPELADAILEKIKVCFCLEDDVDKPRGFVAKSDCVTCNGRGFVIGGE